LKEEGEEEEEVFNDDEDEEIEIVPSFLGAER
jgi:hypothetical protein